MIDDLDTAADALWRFAVASYDRAGVKPSCLSIQARYGLSISTLLGVIWAGAQGYGRLGATDMETTVRRSVEWHREVIEPLRALRRRLRQHPPSDMAARCQQLRRNLLQQELEAERMEQRLLLQDYPDGLVTAPAEQRWRDATTNAALYTRKSCPKPEPEAMAALGVILHNVFAEIPAADLQREAMAVWRVG